MSNGISAPLTGTPWNESGFGFSPNTSALDRNAMPSANAEAARQKSVLVMDALRRGDTAEADRLMGRENKPQGQIVPRGSGNPKSWFKRKFGKEDKGEVLEGEGKEYEESIASSGVDKESVMGKGEDDGVIR